MPAANSELRMRIGRLRRRIDGRARAVQSGTRRMLSWKTLVRRYPGYAVMAAVGAGLAVSAGLRRGRWLRWIGGLAMRQSAGKIAEQLRQELVRFWAELIETPSAEPSDASDHAQS
jgi:hypothetical protein